MSDDKKAFYSIMLVLWSLGMALYSVYWWKCDRCTSWQKWFASLSLYPYQRWVLIMASEIGVLDIKPKM
jgi:hypothetical protein